MTWKEQEEESTHTFYALHDKPHRFSSCNTPKGNFNLAPKALNMKNITIIDPKVRYYYVCCRDGSYRSSKKKRQTSKTRPNQKQSRKIGDVCISRMYVTELQSGEVQVIYVSAHSNHETEEKEDAFIPLPASSKENIAMKISIGIPIERIMEGCKNKENFKS